MHTPEPWKTIGNEVRDSQNRLVAETGFTPEHTIGTISATEHDDNTLLIGAAPRLLKVLEQLMKAANAPELDPLTMFACIEQARDAITQARGE